MPSTTISELIQRITLLPWQSGWVLGGPRGATLTPPGLTRHWVSTAQIGEWEAGPGPTGVRLRMSKPPAAHRLACGMLSEAFFETWRLGDEKGSSFVLALAPGILVGETDFPQGLGLSADGEPLALPLHATQVAGSGYLAGQISVTPAGRTRFALSQHAVGAADADLAARSWLDRDLGPDFERVLHRRARVQALDLLRPDRREQIARAAENVLAGFVTDADAYRLPWSQVVDPRHRFLALHEAWPLVSALLAIDPEAAGEFFLNLLAAALEAGRVTAVLAARAEEDNESWSVPLLAQAAYEVWLATRDPDFARRAAPALQEYLFAMLRDFAASPTSPRWPPGARFWAPSSAPRPRFEAGLATLLIAELDAFTALAAEAQIDLDQASVFREERSRLADLLQREPVSAQIESWEDWLPVLGEETPEPARRELLRQLATRNASLLTLQPAAATPTSLLPAFLLLSAPCEQAPLRGLIEEAVSAAQHEQADRAAPGHLLAPSWSATVLRLAGPRASATTGRAGSRWLRWLNQRRLLLGSASAAGALLLLLGTAWWTCHRPTPTVPAIETQAGLALRLYQQHRFAEAIDEYEKLFGAGRDHYRADFMIGNACYQLGDFARAQTAFELAARREPAFAGAHMNLALTLFQRGSLEEARQAYLNVIRTFGPAYPDLQERARVALEQINRREHLVAAGAIAREGQRGKE